jgi:hypothetical protein
MQIVQARPGPRSDARFAVLGGGRQTCSSGKPRVAVGEQFDDLLSSNRREDILAALHRLHSAAVTTISLVRTACVRTPVLATNPRWSIRSQIAGVARDIARAESR